MRTLFLLISILILGACTPTLKADYLIENGLVYAGDNTKGQMLNIAIKGDRIVYIGKDKGHIQAPRTIDASGKIVAPGFIDPHTHSIYDLESDDTEKRRNLNYQFQGVTTVFNGNDGFGDPDIAGLTNKLSTTGIGTNTAFFIGHGALRQQVIGGEDRAPSDEEMTEMKRLIDLAMTDGALGLSTGLFYAPGSFSDTDEVVELAKAAAKHDGIYDSHIRDESTYTVGLLNAVDEVLEIARRAGIAVHIAHIKALGVDVWGASEDIVEKIEAAQAEGLRVTADQYPWQASGTRISNALIPRWVKAGTEADYQSRLNNSELADQIRAETAENLRKRGGPDAVLITSGDRDWVNKTLLEVAGENGRNPVDMAIFIAKNGDARIASFNMNSEDIERFMAQSWVMTSSDGSTGHPRKFASYPKKYHDYVVKKPVLTVETFLYRSSGLVAQTFGICERGFLKPGYFADIVVFDPEEFAPQADFQNPELLSVGVSHLFVNGSMAIENGQSNQILPGKVLKKCKGEANHAQ